GRREAAGGHGGDRLFADGVGAGAGGGGDGGGDALVPEPEVGRDRSGRDAVDADAFRPELLRERFGDVEERGFGGAVVDHEPVGVEEGVDGGDVDDRAAALVEHRGDGGACSAQGGEEGQLEGCLEFVVADAEGSVQAQLDAADVVDEDVDPAVLLDGRGDEACGSGGIDEIERHRCNAVDAVERVDGKGAADDVHPFAGEGAHDGEADALAGAGDNCE